MKSFQALSDTFAALGDATRLAILSRLASEGDMTVQEIARPFAMSLPAVSQHLKVLKQSGLVVDRPEGTRRIYRVDPAGVAAMREYLDQMWDAALAAFAIAVEKPETRTTSGDAE